jgi:hypothetical protein
MAEDMIFKAVIKLDGTDDILKKMEGSLPKVGLAAQKEFDKAVSHSMTTGAGGAGTAVGAIITRTVSALANPFMTAQETRIGMMPSIAKMLAETIPGGIGKTLGPMVEGFVESALTKHRQLYSGVRESVTSSGMQLAAMGLAPTDEQIKQQIEAKEEIIKRQQEYQERVTRLTGEHFGDEKYIGEEVAAAGDALNKILKDLADGLGQFTKYIFDINPELKALHDNTKKVNKEEEKKKNWVRVMFE